MTNLEHPTPTSQQGGNGLAVAGFVLSFFTLIPFAGFIAFVLSVTFCAIGWNRAEKEGLPHKGLAIAGIVINIVTLILTILFVVAIISAASELDSLAPLPTA